MRDLFRHDDWNIGCVDAPIAAFLDPAFQPRIQWLPQPPRGCYRADPFTFGDGIYCEEYDLRHGRGRLRRLYPATSQPLTGFPALHLSYPFLVEDDGQVYCIPECWQSGQVRLYRMAPGGLVFEFAGALLENFPGVDSTIFRHEDRWWLAATHQFQHPQRDLFLFYAPRLPGPWTPHPANPVKSDLRSSRPGGTPFVHRGELFRPAQDCSRTYGGGIALNRILELNPQGFREETVRWLYPSPSEPWSHGLHTLSAAGDRTLVDGKRFRFHFEEFRRALRERLR